MNFSDEGNSPHIAANIPMGHRSLIYQTKPVQRFTHVFQYIGGITEGQQAFHAHMVPPEVLAEIDPKWLKVFLPIKFLARIAAERSPTNEKLFQLTGFDFRPVGYPMQYITAVQYDTIFSAVKWDWIAVETS